MGYYLKCWILDSGILSINHHSGISNIRYYTGRGFNASSLKSNDLIFNKNLKITKQNEQIYHLLAIALNFYPMRIDDSINSYLKEKYSEKLLKLQRGSVYCLPKL